MRMQVGKGFPLKDPSSTRLIHTEKIRQGTCPFDHELVTHTSKLLLLLLLRSTEVYVADLFSASIYNQLL